MSEKKVLTVMDRATKLFGKASGDLAKMLAEIEALPVAIADLATEVEFKQSNLDAITEDTKTVIRLAKAEIALKVTENEVKVMNELLKKNNLATITVGELNDLKSQLEDAITADEDTVTKAVKAAQSVLHAEYQGKLNTQAANQKVEVAQKDADIRASRAQVAYMTETITDLKADIVLEREARVAIAEAASNAKAITVNNSK